MEWRGIFSHLYFFNTIIANDENDKQNFNTFYINFNPIFLQLNLNPIEFNSQIQSNVFEFNLVILNSTEYGLKSIQVICNDSIFPSIHHSRVPRNNAKPKFPCIIMQVVCDVYKKFQNVCARQLGKIHNGGQFKMSNAQLKNCEILSKS